MEVGMDVGVLLTGSKPPILWPFAASIWDGLRAAM